MVVYVKASFRYSPGMTGQMSATPRISVMLLSCWMVMKEPRFKANPVHLLIHLSTLVQ